MRNVMQSRVSGVEAVSEGDYAYRNLVSPTSTDPMRVLGSTGVGPVQWVPGIWRRALLPMVGARDERDRIRS